MKRIMVLVLAAAAGLTTPAAWGAAEEFQARLFQEGLEYKALKIKIVIEAYTMPEEVARLNQVLTQQGFDPFMSALQAVRIGSLQPIGGRGLKVNLNAGYSIPTEKGRRILLFATSQGWDVGSHQRVDPRFLFMMVELNIDEKGKGNGKIYEQASVRITRENVIEMDASGSPPRQLFDVRPVK